MLTDINMPKMDGLQLLAAMKASPEWRDIPVVMITTEGGETKVGEAVGSGRRICPQAVYGGSDQGEAGRNSETVARL